jgi:uncharacterized protein (DUF1015 family)
LTLAAFPGLRYDPTTVDLTAVVAPPYDVIDAAERHDLLERDPHNVVHLTLPDSDGESETVYQAAARRLTAWRGSGVLRNDPAGLYVYEQATPGHVQRGLVGALELTPAEDGIVLPHENTMAGPVADRLALLAATEVDLEPIFLVYDGGGAATAAVAGVDELPALVTVDGGGARHRLWRLDDEEQLAAIAADLAPRRALIADGHHRYATYLRYQQQRHQQGDGPGAWDRGLAFLVDSSDFGPEVHAIHRVAPGLPMHRAAELARADFRVSPLPSASPPAMDEALLAAAAEGPAFVITDGDAAALLTHPEPAKLEAALPGERSPAWQSLDVNVAHYLLFARSWQLDDAEGIIDFVHDVDAAVLGARRSHGTALLLAPTPVAAVAAVAAAGDRMPRKSTLFVPKPATGIVMRALRDEPDGSSGGASGA